MLYQQFTLPLLKWFDANGRKELPWQHPRSAYRVWISEIMLQQTQVQTVIPYFERFMQQFPTLLDLSVATEDAVLSLWSGLGYYSRARNIYKTAIILQEKYQGQFPQTLADLQSLPGIGESTAAAILSQAFNLPEAILDANVKRVLSRYFMVAGMPTLSQTRETLWKLARACMCKQRCAEYTQAIMDLGAGCCKHRNPDCINCPLNKTCLAYEHNQTEYFPNKAKKKTLPHKKQQFLLCYTPDQRIFLEKRPDSGIWGGLWSLPQISEQDNPIQFLQKQYAFFCLQTESFVKLTHTFTHFKLHIDTALFLIAQPELQSTHQGKWFSFLELEQIGLAQPIKKIIHQFYNR